MPKIESMIATDHFSRSPLQLAAQCSRLDIARLLLSKDAWADHTDARGWTAAFYLWSARDIQMPARTRFLKLLSLDGQCNLGALSCQKWTALHRAAACGTAEDVEVLIRYVADPSICTEGLGWSPLYYSTFFQQRVNPSRVDELLAIPQYQFLRWKRLDSTPCCSVVRIMKIS